MRPTGAHRRLRPALIFASVVYAEWSTAAAYADAVDARLPTRPTSRPHAHRVAARVLADTCGCDRWWTSFGTDHDPRVPSRQEPHTVHAHPTPAVDLHPDAELLRLLGRTVDTETGAPDA